MFKYSSQSVNSYLFIVVEYCVVLRSTRSSFLSFAIPDFSKIWKTTVSTRILLRRSWGRSEEPRSGLFDFLSIVSTDVLVNNSAVWKFVSSYNVIFRTFEVNPRRRVHNPKIWSQVTRLNINRIVSLRNGRITGRFFFWTQSGSIWQFTASLSITLRLKFFVTAL